MVQAPTKEIVKKMIEVYVDISIKRYKKGEK